MAARGLAEAVAEARLDTSRLERDLAAVERLIRSRTAAFEKLVSPQVSIDTTKVKAALADIDRAAKAVKGADVKVSADGAKATADAIDQIAKSAKSIGSVNLRAEAEGVNQAIAQIERLSRVAGDATRTVTVKIDANAAGALAEIERVTAAANAAGNVRLNIDASGGDGIAAAANGLQGVGASATGALGGLTSALGPAGAAIASTTLALAGGAKIVSDAVGIFGDYDQALRRIEATTGVTGAALDQLGSLFQRLGSDAELGAVSTVDAVRAYEQLTRAGLSSAQAQDALRSTLQLSIVTQQDATKTATQVGEALNIFRVNASQTQEVVDALANAEVLGASSAAAYAEALSAGGTTFAQSFRNKEPIENIQAMNAALVVFDKAGISGSEAGTLLRSTLNDLSTPSDIARKALGELTDAFEDAGGSLKGGGDIFRDAQGQLRPLSEAFDNLQLSIDNLDPKQALLLQQRVFTTFGLQGATLLRNSRTELDGIAASIAKVGTAATIAEANAGGVKGAIDAVKGAAETAAKTLGSVFAPLVQAGAQGAARAFSAFDAAIPGIVDQLSPITDAIGDLFGALEPLGAAFSEGFAFSEDDADLARGAIQSIASAIEAVIPVIERYGPTFAKAFGGAAKETLVGFANTVGSTIDVMIGGFSIVGRLLETVGKGLDALGEIPGLDKLNGAGRDLRDFGTALQDIRPAFEAGVSGLEDITASYDAFNKAAEAAASASSFENFVTGAAGIDAVFGATAIAAGNAAGGITEIAAASDESAANLEELEAAFKSITAVFAQRDTIADARIAIEDFGNAVSAALADNKLQGITVDDLFTIDNAAEGRAVQQIQAAVAPIVEAIGQTFQDADLSEAGGAQARAFVDSFRDQIVLFAFSNKLDPAALLRSFGLDDASLASAANTKGSAFAKGFKGSVENGPDIDPNKLLSSTTVNVKVAGDTAQLRAEIAALNNTRIRLIGDVVTYYQGNNRSVFEAGDVVKAEQGYGVQANRPGGLTVNYAEGRLGYDEYFIPTDPKHRSRAERLTSDLARDLGGQFVKGQAIDEPRLAAMIGDEIAKRLRKLPAPGVNLKVSGDYRYSLAGL